MNKELERYVDSLVEYERNKRVEKLANIFKMMLHSEKEGESYKDWRLDDSEHNDKNMMSANSGSSCRSSECAGTYYVDGYTREDGTEVEGYMRTCGAAHEGNQDTPEQEQLNNEQEDKGDVGLENPVLEDSVEKTDKYGIDGTETGKAANMSSSVEIDSVMPRAGIKIPHYKKQIIDYNNEKNYNYKDARDFMNIALIGPENVQNTKEFKVARENEVEQLSKIIGYDIPSNIYTVIFTSKSSLQEALQKSMDLKNAISEWQNSEKPSNSIFVSFKSDQNLFRSLHNVTIFNPEIKDGFFTGFIYDLYDFKLQLLKDSHTTFVNTGAVLLQDTGNLENYNIIIPIKLKL